MSATEVAADVSTSEDKLQDTVNTLKKQLADFQAELSQWQHKANKAEREARQLRQILLELRGETASPANSKSAREAPSPAKSSAKSPGREQKNISPKNGRPNQQHKEPHKEQHKQQHQQQHHWPQQHWPQQPAAWNQHQWAQQQHQWHQHQWAQQQQQWHQHQWVQQQQQWHQHQMQNWAQQASRGRGPQQKPVDAQVRHLPAQARGAEASRALSPTTKVASPPPPDIKKVAAEAAIIDCRQALRDATDAKTLQGAIEMAKSLGMADAVRFGEAKLVKLKAS